MLLTTAALIAAGVTAAGGALGGAINRGKARNTANSNFDYMEDVAKSEQYNSIFNSPYGKSLLKLQDTRDRKDLDAVNNLMAAGGGTMENALAARQSINENRDRITSQLLQYDDRNRRAWKEKELDIANQRANYNANSYMQAAQDWNQWGSQAASSFLSLGSTGLLGGMGGLGAGAAVDAVNVAGSGANVYNAAVAASRSPQVNIGSIPVPHMKA